MKRLVFFSWIMPAILMFTFLAIMAWTNVVAGHNGDGFFKEVPVFVTGFTIQEIMAFEQADYLFVYALADTSYLDNEKPQEDMLKIPAITLPVNSQEVGYRRGIGKLCA